MNKLKIKEVIVVEGKHDLEKIKQSVNADVIYSNGLHISKSFLALCKKFNEAQGIIIFTDPDGPGEMIRKKIMNYVGNCKHASLNVIQSKKKQKVGIEHADAQDIVDALTKAAEFVEGQESITQAEFIDLGLSGQSDSRERRALIAEAFFFPLANAKTCFKYLNMLNISKVDCETILVGEEL